MTEQTTVGGEEVRDIMASLEMTFSQEEVDFLIAIDRYKAKNSRAFPTWREVLAVARSLGYRKVAEPIPLPRYVRMTNGSTTRPEE